VTRTGKIISTGTSGIAINARFSFGTPPSISFKLVTLSAAANPI